VGFFERLFNRKQEFVPSEEQLNEFFNKKAEAMKKILGDMYEVVGHSVIAFHAGGAVDMYYFPNAIDGTAMATMELIDYENRGPVPNRNGMYELVAFTRHKVDRKAGTIPGNTPFDKIERRMCKIFTCIGRYSYEVKIEPGETCEIPGSNGEEGICLVFDEYKKKGTDFEINGKKYGLLTCIEVFRSEMEYAMKNGSHELFKLLKQHNYYPYSDMDREPVV